MNTLLLIIIALSVLPYALKTALVILKPIHRWFAALLTFCVPTAIFGGWFHSLFSMSIVTSLVLGLAVVLFVVSLRRRHQEAI